MSTENKSSQNFVWCMAILNALIFLMLGIYFFIFAEQGLDAVDLQAASGIGVIEVRAMYGGLEFGIGLLFGYWLFRRKLRAVLVASVFMMCGLLLGRISGMLLSQQTGFHITLAIVEATAIVLDIAALALHIRQQKKSS